MPAPAPAPLPLAGHVARWGDDPWARGAWSTLAPGGRADDRATLGRPIGDRLVLAGEATDPLAPAMVHGAWSAGREAAHWAASLQQPGEPPVVVVGAGMAGVAAAAALSERGVASVVLEARSRLGGRIHTVDLAGVAVDVGAAWVQQRATNPLATLVDELGLATVPTDFARPLASSAVIPGDRLDTAVHRARARLTAVLATAPPTATTLADVVSTIPHEDDESAFALDHVIDADVVAESGLEPRDMAVDAAAEPGVGEGDRWLPGGYSALIDHLVGTAGRAQVHLDWPVTSITIDEVGATAGVLVSGPHGVIAGSRCICTVPVGVLPHLEFRPGLPDSHRRALRGLRMGVVEKVALRYEQRWWPRSPSGYLRWYDRPASWVEWLDLTDGASGAAVAGVIAGDAVAREHRGTDDAGVIANAHLALQRWATRLDQPR